MPKLKLRHAFVALMITLAMLAQGTWALAGTTGNISGTLTDSTNGKPVADAKITVVSPSQSASATTDAGGHFTLLSLAPDTYTVSVEKEGYTPTSLAGVTVFADQTQSIALTTQPQLKTIARVTSRAAGALVRPGTTSDVYSVNATTAAKVTGLGGGGSLDQAYSAIATMPGAYVPVGGAGWYQTVYIRGGDYDQVGYEVDGVPVNRAFDNYPSNTASALGQQEVQVYTGAAPSNAEGQGLSGFINQVIKSGTYPGFGNADLALGGPDFYHKAMVEAGGATPNRTFSYYVGLGGYNQDYREFDQNNGASISGTWGYPTLIPCSFVTNGADAPGCYNSAGQFEGNNLNGGGYLGGAFGTGWYVLGPYNYYNLSNISDRENVANFHFAIPHKYDGGRDDLQLLWQASDLVTRFYSTPSDFTYGNSASFLNGVGGLPLAPPFFYPTGVVYNGSLNQLVSATNPNPSGLATPVEYCFPSISADNGACGGQIPNNMGDDEDNAIGLVKLQYQKNFGSSAYLRLYGYTVYSNWFNWGPVSANLCCTGVPVEYEVYTHTRGVSGTFADQINPKNLLQLQASYVDANSNRINNGTMFNGGATTMGVLVNGNSPNSGICYDTTGTPQNCDNGAASFTINDLACAQNPNFMDPSGAYCANNAAPISTVAAGTTCGGGPCQYDVVDTGYSGRANRVEPKFWSGSITDDWNLSDALHLNLGARFDSFQYVPSDTMVGAKPFWTAAWNQSYCTNPSTPTVAPVEKNNVALPCSDPANAGTGFVPATITNVSSTQTYTVFQPRFGLTYTLNPFNVLRMSWGKYDQAPNTAFEQYDALNQNLADENANFYTLGFTAPTHPIRPEVSYNGDISWEHQVKGSDLSWKITPFYRSTKDQVEQFYLNIQTNFVSGLNVGQQTTDGVEFQLQKGDFNRNGLSGLLSYTYTNAHIKFQPTSNGTTVVSTINAAIQQFNGYTKGGGGAPCYTPATGSGSTFTPGTPVTNPASCTAADIANPYYNMSQQGLLDPNGSYAPYDLFPAGAPGAGGYDSFVAPHVATLVLNYKHDKLAITPALQFSSGTKYGYPINMQGVDPSTCEATLGSTSGDPRYPNGGAGGSSYDYTSCLGSYSIPIPDTATGKFDDVGQFTNPNRVTLSTQLSYDVSPRVTAVLTMANIVDRCFGGSKEPWTTVAGVSSSKVCGYGGGFSFLYPPVGNNYNPPISNVQPFQQPAYSPQFGSLPFNAYLDFRIKL